MNITVKYECNKGCTTWTGILFQDGEDYLRFLKEVVYPRLVDTEGNQDFSEFLDNLPLAGFETDTLRSFLLESVVETRPWAIGEAIAEGFLQENEQVMWPWNMERDKRNQFASLPGADLVGFKKDDGKIRIVIGEVKTSSDFASPPGVMSGKSGMEHQLSDLASDPNKLYQLIKWLFFRVRSTDNEKYFREACTNFLKDSNNDKAISLYGVLIRDTQPNILDLQSRGQRFARKFNTPTTCKLLALHIPCEISELPNRITGGG